MTRARLRNTSQAKSMTRRTSFARSARMQVALNGCTPIITPRIARRKVTIRARQARTVIKAPLKSIKRRCLLLFLNMKNGVLKNPKRSPRSIKKLPAIPIVIRIAVDS